MSLVHVVPRFFPQLDGLGDYCALLRSELLHRHGLGSRVVVGDPDWVATLADSKVVSVSARTAAALLSALDEATTVILHYVGYGYHRRGVPFWINQALLRWKGTSSRHRLIIIFHELWAFGPPWKTEFYTSPVQRWLCRQLHQLADASLVSVPVNLRRLEAINPGKTAFQPIPSAFPTDAPDRSSRGGERPLEIIAFGQEGSRLRSLATHQKLLQILFERGRLGRVRIVGKNASADGADVRLLNAFLPAEKIEIHSDVAPTEGARLLRVSDFFLSFYPSAFICKSSALMAALGNGCVPLLAEAADAAPLTEGRELLACDGSAADIETFLRFVSTAGALDDMSRQGRSWYAAHASWEAVAHTVATLLAVPTVGAHDHFPDRSN